MGKETVVWNRVAMLDRLMGDEDFAAAIVQKFLVDIPNRIQAIDRLLEAGDISGIGFQAHAIKGSSASLGGERLQMVAAELEMVAKEQDAATVPSRIEELRTEFQRLQQAMQDVS
jgi:HPt (histidine-containing phosphotransfer) domain-containing protein